MLVLVYFSRFSNILICNPHSVSDTINKSSAQINELKVFVPSTGETEAVVKVTRLNVEIMIVLAAC